MTSNSKPALTLYERRRLNECISLRDWHLKAMIQDRCIEIGVHYIAWENDAEGNSKPVKAIIYGLNGVYSEDTKKNIPSLRNLILYYSIFALITITAALFIPHFAEQIATKTGLGNSFVGTVFVAGSTSLPEIAVSIAAVRFGSIDLAIGNLLGSNIFNILILAIDDLFYTKGVLLKDASDIHLVSVFSCLVMSAIAIAGFTYRAPKKKFLMAVDAILILAFYFFNLILLYYLTR